MKKTFIIDGNNFNDLAGFYDEIEKVLTKDFRMGRNLDAFVDVLRGGFNQFSEEEVIILFWKNISKSKKDLGYEETLKYCREKLVTCHPTAKKIVLNEIKNAERNIGPTLFDIIIEIIKSNKNVELI